MTARRLRVLHLVRNLNYGGMERLIHDLARLADGDAFDVHVMALDYVGRFGQGLAGVAQVHLAGRMEPWSLVRPGALAACIRRISPDVVALFRAADGPGHHRHAGLVHATHGGDVA